MLITKEDLNMLKNDVINSVVHTHNSLLYNILNKELSLIDHIKLSAKLSSVKYVEENMYNAVLLTDYNEFRKYTLSKVKLNGIAAEFGVWKGGSINFIADTLKQTIYGFDSFEGLKEDWKGDVDHTQGKFNLNGVLPEVRSNVTLVKGWFNETIPNWLKTIDNDWLSFIHIDCDTYESSKIVLNEVGHMIKPGTVVMFDEYIGRPAWKHNEFRAWQEFVKDNGIKYEYLAACEQQVSVAIL
jgi:hypothetical protein